MRIGVFRTSFKENERRVPIYPEDMLRFPESLRLQMVFETHYGSDYGFMDDYFRGYGAVMADRDRLFAECDLVILPRPVAEDLVRMNPIVALIIILHGQENPCNASNPFALLRFRSRSIEVDHAGASAGQRAG